MGDEAAFIAKTQQTLGAIVKKPPLSEKLLAKPPFRFLHDVITAVIRTTGFAKGLYTEDEMKSENVADKEAKIAFLNKALAIVQFATNEPLGAKAAKIVAGAEPDKTNEFLQMLAQATRDAPESGPLVQRVLAGEKPEFKKAEASDGSAGSNKENRDKTTSKEGSKAPKKAATEGEKPRKSHKEGSEGTSEAPKEPKKSRVKTELNGEAMEKPSKSSSKAAEAETEKPAKPKEKHHRPKAEKVAKEDTIVANGHMHESDEPIVATESKLKPPTAIPASMQESSKRPISRSAQDGQSRARKSIDEAADAQMDSLEPTPKATGGIVRQIKSARPAARPGTSAGLRPTTAKPAPPKVRRQELSVDEQSRIAAQETASIAPVATIIADSAANDADENFIVEEAPAQILGEDEVLPEDYDENADHGGLVKKILETKKDLERNLKYDENARPMVTYDAKERERTKKEAAKLQEFIQQLTRNAHPLGKIMDYLQEDVDSMVKEMDGWRQEYRQNEEKLRQQKSTVSGDVEGNLKKIEELEQQIKEQMDAISATKSVIMENEEKIQRLMISVTKK